MKMLKLKVCEMFIKHYEKRWKNAIDGMNKNINDSISPEFRKYCYLNSKYGHKTLVWMHKKSKILKELN